jgi:hypothetical protein
MKNPTCPNLIRSWISWSRIEEVWIRLSIEMNSKCQTQQQEHELFHGETGTLREQSASSLYTTGGQRRRMPINGPSLTPRPSPVSTRADRSWIWVGMEIKTEGSWETIEIYYRQDELWKIIQRYEYSATMNWLADMMSMYIKSNEVHRGCSNLGVEREFSAQERMAYTGTSKGTMSFNINDNSCVTSIGAAAISAGRFCLEASPAR